jgi:hypothetical protein
MFQKQLRENIQEKIKIETPIGVIESDSGNHIIDILTVIILSFIIMNGLKMFRKDNGR